MAKPVIRSGRFHAGSHLQCGENVIIDVAEEVRVGDRCVLAPNTYLGGRSVSIGDDFFGYDTTHLGNALDIGRGRRDEEGAVLTVGSRCTFHNNRIDLARRVTICDDVGLSPDVVIYTHGYWQSPLEGFPCQYEPAVVGDSTIIGFRSIVLPGADVGRKCVVGAGSVVTGKLEPWGVYGGNPAKLLREIVQPSEEQRRKLFQSIMQEYARSLDWRDAAEGVLSFAYPHIELSGCTLDVEKLAVKGQEGELSDDLRWFLFTRGIRIYTKRPFRKMEMR